MLFWWWRKRREREGIPSLFVSLSLSSRLYCPLVSLLSFIFRFSCLKQLLLLNFSLLSFLPFSWCRFGSSIDHWRWSRKKRESNRGEREKWNKKEMIRGRDDRGREGRNCVLFLPTFLCSLFCFVASCYVSLSLGRPLLHNFVHLRWWWDVCCSRSCRSFSWLFFYFSLSLSL